MFNEVKMLSITSISNNCIAKRLEPKQNVINHPALRIKSPPPCDVICFAGKKSASKLSIGPETRLDVQEISKKEYETQLEKLQLKLTLLQQKARELNKEVILVFEGWDAAGKGGAIKRLTEKMDPRGCKVHAIGAPTKEELDKHYLCRFWDKLQGKRSITIFDRSWYGRVLVERIEKFAKPEEWERAYKEINDFEKNLTDNGALVIKFFMDISKDEQLKRFESRKTDPFRSWKLTDEDWRNRDKWDQYKDATADMYNKTNKNSAPWHIIQSDSKKNARIEVLKIVTKALEKACDVDPDKFYPKEVR